MNDENELNQNNSASTQNGYYIPTLIALDGDKVKERTNNNNISIISINEEYFSTIENTINSTNNVSIAGFSRAGASAIYQSANAIANGSTISSVFVIDDGTPHVDQLKYRNAVQTIANSGTSIFFIGQHSDNNNSVLRADAQEYAKTAGMAIVIRNTNTSGHGSGYNQIYTRTISDNLVGYLNGSGELTNTTDYAFDVFDNATQTWSTYTYEQFQAKVAAGEIELSGDPLQLAGLQSLKFSPIKFDIDEYEKIQSDDTVLQGFVDGIRNNLKIEASVHSYNSTTMVPSEESGIVNEFLEGTQSLFGIIESDTTYLLKMGLALKEMDANLAAKGMEIDDAPSKDGSSSSSLSGWEIAGIFLKNVAGGAAVGLVSGSFVPVIGNIAGAVIGVIAGVVTSFIQISASNSSNRTVTVNDNIDPIDINNR